MTLVLQTFFVFEEKYLYFPAGQKLCNNLMLTDARIRLNRSRRHDIINLLQSKGTSDMQYSETVNFLMMLSNVFIAAYATLLVEFRSPEKVWMRRCVVITGGLIIVNAFFRAAFGGDNYQYVAVFLLTLPYTLLILWCSRYRGFKIVFNVCTCLWMGCTADTAGILAQSLFPGHEWVRLVVRVIGFTLLYFLLRTFRPYYRRMLRILEHGWGILCIPPMVTSFTILYLNNELLPKDPLPVAIALICVTAICAGAYVLIFQLFTKELHEHELKNSRQLMDVQIHLLERQMKAMSNAEEAMKVQRHDMRHQWAAISELVESGNKEAALGLIGTAREHLEDSRAHRWCENDVLNAMFAYYFEQAERGGIDMKIEIDFPEKLPVGAVELSMVFANALENAIRACKDVPEGKRKIMCRSIRYPNLMMKIENTCSGYIEVDSEGLPVSSGEGHGIGSRSIAAFCKKYGAMYDYQVEDGWFRLRISMPKVSSQKDFPPKNSS